MNAQVIDLQLYRAERVYVRARRVLTESALLRARAESALFLSSKLNIRTCDHNGATGALTRKQQ